MGFETKSENAPESSGGPKKLERILLKELQIDILDYTQPFVDRSKKFLDNGVAECTENRSFYENLVKKSPEEMSVDEVAAWNALVDFLNKNNLELETIMNGQDN